MTRLLVWACLTCLAMGAGIGRTAGEGPQEPELIPSNFPAPEFPLREIQPPEQEAAPPEELNRRPSIPQPGRQLPEAEISGTVWLNSPPQTMAGLRGKVVLIDFWEYTCINCIRTFAENKKWYARYHRYGFEIVGVHDPEFDIAYSVDNVRAAVKRFGLPYPIVVDDGFKIWRSYHNSTWPNRFLVDAHGMVRYHRPGEGADGAFERAIQELLREAKPNLKFPSSYTIPPEKDLFAPSCGFPTSEMYVGDWYDRGILANVEGYRDGKTMDYQLPADVADGQAVVAGPWETDKSGMVYRGKKKGETPSSDELKMRYHARELYAVLNASHGRPSRLYVRQDGKDLTGENKGVDVRFDAQGHSYLDVREPRMYYLVSNATFGSHEVELLPTRGGLTVNSFTFGNNCQTDFPHL